MPTTKEIKNRINSVSDTRKITNAMYLISSSKMTKAKRLYEQTTPFFRRIRREIRRIFDSVDEVKSIFVYDENEKKPDTDGRYGYLVITADKGLAGAHNMNIIKKVLSLTEEHENYLLLALGEYGRNFFTSHGYNVSDKFLYDVPEPDMDAAREITEHLLTLYENNKIEKLFIVYTRFVNAFKGGEVAVYELLPFEKGHFYNNNAPDNADTEFEFLPSPEVVLDRVLRTYLSGFIYAAIANSFCSEQCARMTAMEAANKSADDLLNSLSMEYNHIRQSSITNEITEISSGARSLRRTAAKRKKKEALS